MRQAIMLFKGKGVIFKNISGIVLGNIVFSICQWINLSVLARFGNEEMVGQFTLAFAIVAPVFMFSGLQLRSLIATDTNSAFSIRTYMQTRTWMNLFSLAVIGIIALFLKDSVETKVIVIMTGMLKVIEGFSDLSYGVSQKNDRSYAIGVSLFLRGIVSSVLFSSILYSTNSLFYSMLAYIFSWLIIYIFYDHRVNNLSFIVRGYTNESIKLFRMSIALGTVLLLISLNANIQKYCLSLFLTVKEVGVFSTISYLIVIGSIFVNGVSQVISPRIARIDNTSNYKDLTKLVRKLNTVGLAIAAMGIFLSVFWGKEILVMMYGKDYSAYVDLLILICIGAAFSFMSAFMGYVLTAIRVIKSQPILQIILIVVSLVSSVAFIPLYGLYGACYSFIITNFIQWLGSHFLYKKHLYVKAGGERVGRKDSYSSRI